MDSRPLPPPILNFACQNEDASVEALALEALSKRDDGPLRVLAVASCGTHVVSMCASPRVGRIDAVDVSPPQLMAAQLTAAGAAVLDDADELAALLGNADDDAERLALYERVREGLPDEARAFWDENRATVEAGILACGGSERIYADVRAHLPSKDPEALARDPEAIAAAMRAGFDVERMAAATVGIPAPILKMISERVVPAIVEQLNAHLTTRDHSAPPDFILHMFLTGKFPTAPDMRPLFLQPGVFSEIEKNGCGPDRLRFHQGPLQEVGKRLAAAEGQYDLVDISNILDMAPPDAVSALVTALRDVVRPGGLLLGRWSNQPGALAKIFRECGFDVDSDLSARLKAAESSFFMTEVCAARPEA